MGCMANFENLVQVESGEPLTTSLHVAEWTGVKHKNVLELVHKYNQQLQVFGLLAFQTRPRSLGQHGGGDIEYALLNEGQATLLITFMRNTERVIDFKVALVKAFLAARNLITSDYMGLAKKHAALCMQLEDERQVASLAGRNLSVWKQKHKDLRLAIDNVQQKMQLRLSFD